MKDTSKQTKKRGYHWIKQRVVGVCFRLTDSANKSWRLFRQQPRYRQGLMVILILLVGLILIVFITIRQHRPIHQVTSSVSKSKHTMQQPSVTTTDSSSVMTKNEVTETLSDLQEKLVHIEQQLAHPDHSHSAVTTQAITALQTAIDQLKTMNETYFKRLTTQIEGLQTQVINNQKQMQSQLTEMVASQHAAHCLSGDHLPFVVKAIDIINGQNVVTVQYDDQVAAIEQGRGLAGWQLVKVDYPHQTARFNHAESRCVDVALQGGKQ